MKKNGIDYRVWIESTTPGTYSMIKGQDTHSINRAGGTVDATSKDDFPYGSSLPGTRSVSIPFSIIPDLPDATGYTRLESLANASVSTPFNIQIRKGGTSGSGTDVVFQCSVYVTDFNTTGDRGPVKASCTFVNAAAPTVDVLA